MDGAKAGDEASGSTMICDRCGGLKVEERFYGTDSTVPV